MPVYWKPPLFVAGIYAKKLYSFSIAKKSPFTKANFETLTQRERDCLQQVVLGKTAKEIGDELQISYRTVENHMIKIKNKLRSKRKIDLIRFSKEIIF